MASFTAGTTFVDGVSNDVTAAKLGNLVTNATPTSGFIQDRTAETVTATNDTLLIGDASDSNNLKRITVANFAQTLPTAKVTTGTIETGTFGTTTSTAATITTGTIPTLVATTLVTTGTGTAAAPAIVPTGDTNTGIFFPAADTIAFSEGGTESMRIDSSGNVGIGTTTPYSKLNIFSSITSGDTGEATGVGSLRITNGASALSSDGGLEFKIAGDSNGYGAKIQALNSSGIQLAFANRSATGTWSERMRIDSSGNVGIGTASPSAQLELSTDSAKKPSTNTWTIASDQRLKTNITNADNNRCYEIVKQVPLKRYTWRSEVYSQEKVKDRSKLGWIAQDVEEVFPKAVGTSRFAYNQVFEDVITPELDSDGNAVLDENGIAKTKTEKRLVSEDVIEDCKDLNSDQIYAAMYGTIQKLIEKVESLESKVAALEAA